MENFLETTQFHVPFPVRLGEMFGKVSFVFFPLERGEFTRLSTVLDAIALEMHLPTMDSEMT